MKTIRARVGLAAILPVLIAVSATAGPFNFGAKAGLSFAEQTWTYGDPGFKTEMDWRSGFAGGVMAELPIAPYLSARFEVLVVQKGYKQTQVRTDEFANVLGTFDVRARINDLTINALAKGELPGGTYFLAGPRIDFKLGTGISPGDAVFEKLSAEFTTPVVGLTFGLGQELRVMPSVTPFVEGQYYLDIGKLYHHTLQGYDKVGTLESIKNRSLAFYVGVKF
jgi:hypothetical protein